MGRGGGGGGGGGGLHSLPLNSEEESLLGVAPSGIYRDSVLFTCVGLLLLLQVGNMKQPRAAANIPLALSPVAGERVKGGSIAARSLLRSS